MEKHPRERLYVASDNPGTHQNDESEAVVWARPDAWYLLYMPTYSPWLGLHCDALAHFRREVTHRELFATAQGQREATRA